ncbi:unnamed protein product [Caenorhabditis brenneri]
MLFAGVLLLLAVSGSFSAPTCEPNSFCYNPSDSVKATLTRNGSVLNLRIYYENSTIGNVHLVQKDGKDVVVRCGEESSCKAELSVEQFDKNLPISIQLSDSQKSDTFSLDSLSPPLQQGLTKDQRRQFSKAHAILMIFGWLLFVPTGFIFMRLGKDLFVEEKIFGSPVWFQVHRAANFMGVVCICASMLCIYISQQWTWKGTGSGSKYWTEVHTDLGVISTVLAVAQPINSLFRCGPTHSQRYIFNWAHRMVGIIAYTLALTAIIIAAVQFKRIWNEPLLELVLVCLPIFICLVATIVFTALESDRFKSKASFGQIQEVNLRLKALKNRRGDRSTTRNSDSMETPLITDENDFDENSKPLVLRAKQTPHVLKAPTVFWATGVFFCIAVALSLLVVNGYKS